MKYFWLFWTGLACGWALDFFCDGKVLKGSMELVGATLTFTAFIGLHYAHRETAHHAKP